MKIVRLYTGDDGRSHFEDVTPALVLATADDHASVEMFESKLIATKGVVISRIVHHDRSGSMHNVPQRQLMVQLTGETEIEACGGETRLFGPGTVLLAEDTTGEGHTTRGVVGGEPRLAIFIHLAEGETL
jgi:hypothetical protein